MDLNEDLARGLINIPAEDIRRFAIDLQAENPGLETWMAREARQVRRLFSVALEETSRLELKPLRRLLMIHLTRKRYSMNRHLRNDAPVRISRSTSDRPQIAEVFAPTLSQTDAPGRLDVGPLVVNRARSSAAPHQRRLQLKREAS